MYRFFKSLGYALKGINHVVKTQHNFRLQLIAAVLVSLLGYCVALSSLEWAVILICIAMVLAFELMNTAVEQLVDFFSPEWNEKAGMIKDIAAAAVLLAALIALAVAFVIFVPKFLN